MKTLCKQRYNKSSHISSTPSEKTSHNAGNAEIVYTMMHLANRHFAKILQMPYNYNLSKWGKDWGSPEHVVAITDFQKRVELGDEAMVHMSNNNYEKFCWDFFNE